MRHKHYLQIVSQYPLTYRFPLHRIEQMVGAQHDIKEDEELEQTISPVKTTDADAAKKRIKRMSVVGTRGFMAPEILEGKVLKRRDRRGYDETVDWFALGVTTFVMLTGGQPFSDEDPAHVSQEVLEKEFPRDAKGNIKRPPGYASLMQVVKFPSHMTHSACHFCKNLLSIRPENRLGKGGIAEVQTADWFSRTENPASPER